MPEFPTIEWFEAVRERANDDAQFRAQGSCNCRMGVKAGDVAVVVTFEGFECAGVVRAADVGDLRGADFYLDMTPDEWREFLGNIAANGGADSAHTLNALDLTMANGCVKAHDELGRTAFFQYHLSLQAFFDASARVETEFR